MTLEEFALQLSGKITQICLHFYAGLVAGPKEMLVVLIASLSGINLNLLDLSK